MGLAVVRVTPVPNVAAVTEVPARERRVSGAADPMAVAPAAAAPAAADRDEVVRWVPPLCCLRLPAMA